MRNLPPRILVLSAFFTAMASATAITFVATPAMAQPKGGASFDAEFERIRQEMKDLWLEMHNFKPLPKYCLPPLDPMKFPHTSAMQVFGARTKALMARFRANRQSLQDFLAGNHELEKELMLNGVSPRERSYWRNNKFQLEADRLQRKFNEKDAELKAKPERNCAPSTPPKKEIEVIGGNPPVQPPPPPPPPPVDPLRGLTRPPFTAINIPPLSKHYCSQQEKNAVLALLPPEIAKAQAQIEANEAYIGQLRVRRGELEQRRVESHWLTSMDYEIHQAEIMIADRRTTIEAIETTRRLIESTPVVDCTTGKEIGSLPGNTGASVEVASAAGELTIPKKPYLSLEVGGNQRLGVADVKRTETVVAMLLGLAFDLDCLPKINLGKAFGLGDPLTQRIRVTGELETYDLSLRSSGGSIVTTTEGVGVPGTGDPSHPSPAGYFLANPTINDVANISQFHASSLESLHFAIAQEQYYGRWSGTVAVGGRVGRLETSDSLAGSIPGYGRDFAYHTDLETAIWGLFVATDAELSLDRAWDQWADALRYAGEFSGFTVSAGARAGVDFLSADGSDRLDFTGFAPQSIAVSKDDTTFSYRLNLGLNYTPPSAPALKLSIGAVYGEDDIHPVATRSGEIGDRTRIEFKEQEVFVGTIRSTFKF